jgi:L-asparaginase
MTLSPGPPPWPIPPSWTVTPPRRAAATTDPPPADPGPAARVIALFAPDGTPAPDVPGVAVRALASPAPAPGFAGVYALADAVARAYGEGAQGVVVLYSGDELEEAAWALDLLHSGDAPLVLAADPGRAADVADAIGVAAAAPPGSGCLVVAHGEIHTARHVRRSGAVLSSPGAGPLGQVVAGAPRLRWRPPARLTVHGGATAGRPARVGLHTTVLGDDGELLALLAERCDGLIVAGGLPESIAGAAGAAATRVPVVLACRPGHGLPTTSLDSRKARVLMHLLLSAGRDREAVLAAFAAAEGDGPAQV